MNFKTGLATALVAAVVAALVTAATIALIWKLAPGVVNVSSLDEKRVANVVRDYLIKNPEILVEMTTELDKRQASDQAEKQQKVIGDNAEAIFRSPLAHTAGNPNGDVSVVEFFDYNCGFCRRALPDLKVAIDLNAVPPLGIEGLSATDRGTDRDGARAWGAIGIGGTKMKIHKKAVQELFTANDRVLDAEEVLELGRTLK